MEASEPTCPAPSARDQPAPPPGILGGPGGQASPHLTLGPVILPPEQGLPPTVFLKALPVPLYHTVPPGSLQPRAPLVTGNLDGTSVPLILSPLLQPEGPSPTQVGKPASAALTVNIVGTLPVLSPGLGPTLSSTGRARNAGKYLCPHCGRDCLKPSVLEKHIRSHTGERPFPCTTCGIAFKTQSNLYKHRRTQTHLNNSRLSLESEGGGSSLLEEGDRAGEPTTGDNRGDEGESTLFPGSKNLDRTVEAAPCLGSTLHREAPADSTPMTPPGLPLASPQPRRKLPEPKPCSLQRQQDLCTEKPWDPRASEGRLRKCESTDSGYLSRSDSAEQPLVASSPLHSLSEHSGESEGEGGPGSGPGGNKSDPGAPGTSLELEKKKLEERIAQLISHNQAVVDDPQLDHVRPRKTVLSKQGSIDLPMPYTYKDSFHFDIRALEPSRRRTALSPARSTITPLEKSRPLFFHSVPTQLSTTVECVPVTRSNSLPFIEGSKIWPEPQDPQDACPGMQKPLSSRLVSVRPGCHPGLTLADIPSGHPRALVRQAAVEDLPCTPTGNPTAGAEDLDRTRAVMRERAVCKGGGSKKCSPRKPKMFSHEKWQVYGNETFKRIYQKMKTGHQGAQKSREPRQRHRAEPELPTQEEVPRSENMAPSQGGRTPVLGDSSAEAKPGSWGSQAALEGPLEAESPKPLTAVAKAKSSLTLGGENTLCLSSRSLLLPTKEKLGCQLTPVPGPHKGVDLEASRLALPDSRGEATKETCSWAQTVLRQSSGRLGDPQPVEDKFASERKRMKVEGLGPQEQPETLGEESSGSSVQAVSRPPQKRDSDHGEVLVASYDSAQQVPEVQESFDASLVVSDASLGCSGPGGTTSSLPSVSRPSGHPSVWAAQLQTPAIPAAPAEDTFAPKYLLRLPQGENCSLSATPRPERGPDSVYASAQSKEQASRSGSGLGVPWSSGPSSAPGKAEEPSGARTMDGMEEEHVGGEKGGQANSSSSASRDCPGSPTGATRKAASILPVHVCDTQMGQDMTSETHATHYFCTESSSAIVRTSGVLLNPWTSIQKLGVPPKNALEGPPPDPKEGLPTCCPFQVHRFLTSFTRPQGLSLGQPKLLWTPLGTPEGCGTQSSFPSLRAEPQLTWCCLSRSLPLPSEQQRATSGHSALHPGERSLWDAGSDMLHKSHGGRIKTGRGGGGGGGGPMKAPELSYPTVPGTRVQDPVSTLQWKKGLCRRRVKTSHGNSKKKLRLHSKRCEGSFWQSRAQLRARRRLYKPPWMPRRSCLPHRLEGSEPPGTLGKASSEVAGLSLQGEPSCTSTEVSTGHGSEERKEDSSGQILEPISPTTSPETIREIRKSTLKDISPSAGELDDYSREKDPGDRSGLSLHSNACLVVAKEDLLPQGKDLEVGLLETRLLPPRDQVCIDPSLCISPDMLEPSSSGPKGMFPCHDVVTSVAAICVSVGVRAAHESSAVDSAESLPGETLSHSSSESKATAESPGQACLPGRPSPRQRSPGKSHLEILASGPSSPTSNQEEGELQVDVPSRGQHGCGDAAMRCTASGHDSGMVRAARLITPKGHVPLSDQEPSEVPEAPLRSIRKRSLEGMRKQTRVELSDTSSDDEDRLVIEI